MSRIKMILKYKHKDVFDPQLATSETGLPPGFLPDLIIGLMSTIVSSILLLNF